MGNQDLRVELAAIRAISAEFDRVADLLTPKSVLRTGFGGAVAGRDHVVDGEAVRRAFDQIGADLGQWARAAAEVGSGLRVGAQRYAGADLAAAAGVG